MANKFLVSVIAGVTATVIGGLILLKIPHLRDMSLEAMLWVLSCVLLIWSILVASYSVPGWIFLIFGFFALVGLTGSLVSLYTVLKPKNVLAHHEYTEDMIDGIKWRWSWTNDQITNIMCFCPTCDAQLVFRRNYLKMHLLCERCPSDNLDPQGRILATVGSVDTSFAVDAAMREVLRRVRTNEYNRTQSKNG